METERPSLESVGLKTGLVTSLALLAYFFIMQVLGLSHIIELRIFNFLILAIGICYGIYKLKSVVDEEDFYLKGLAEGIVISIVALVPFALVISLYLAYFNTALMDQIRAGVAMGEFINGFVIFFVIAMEGLASGAVITFCAMQYFKIDDKEEIKDKGLRKVE